MHLSLGVVRFFPERESASFLGFLRSVIHKPIERKRKKAVAWDSVLSVAWDSVLAVAWEYPSPVTIIQVQ
jgi:hypothetical protein